MSKYSIYRYIALFKKIRMFAPHSVRGLLSRRNQTRLHSQQQMDTVPSGGDPDLDSLVDTKLIIKDVQHQIEDIRQWRNHQRCILEERLASNQAVAKVTVDEYLQHLDRQQKKQLEQTHKMYKKLQFDENGDDIAPQKWNNSDTNLFDYVTNSNKFVEQMKYQHENRKQLMIPDHQNFLNQLSSMSEMTLKRDSQTQPTANKQAKTMDRSLISKELQQIQDQLKYIQNLMKD